MTDLDLSPEALDAQCARLRDGCNLQQRDGERAADAITALRDRLAEAEAERDRLRAVWWHQMQSEAMKEMVATALALDEWKARAEELTHAAAEVVAWFDRYRSDLSGPRIRRLRYALAAFEPTIAAEAKGGD
jgi:uncharacterized protein YhaN